MTLLLLSQLCIAYLKCLSGKRVQRLLAKQWGDGGRTPVLGLVTSDPLVCFPGHGKRLMAFTAYQEMEIVTHIQKEGMKLAGWERSRSMAGIIVF